MFHFTFLVNGSTQVENDEDFDSLVDCFADGEFYEYDEDYDCYCWYDEEYDAWYWLNEDTGEWILVEDEEADWGDDEEEYDEEEEEETA
jgi:hypothetical protein